MIAMPLFNKFDREFEEYLRVEKKEKRRDVQLLLAGDGLKRMLEFLVVKKKRNEEVKSQLLEEKKI